ncbi:GD20216 [Drosophila simulans]|uniref:GD20216 n=1 Tax=Drosophila simulans TaxID=7240 RepID=B4QV45_DROSI|nr:GD20216 [Drosophila simulans]
MAVNLQLNNLSAMYPSLMYVAASSSSSSSLRGLGLGSGVGVGGLPENISIVYEDAANGTGGGVGVGYPSGPNGTDAVALTEPGPTAPVTTFNYYNESAAAAEWAHFYDLVLSWQGIILIAVFATFIVVTVIGNTLVILAILTTRRLRTITNCFVMSLAVADLLVGIFVMPPAVAVHLIGSWQLGWVLCDIWISLDVLLCTASILSLCAISVDRYLAVTRPLTYSRKRRSKRLALIMILIVWLLALAITCPPMLGWYEPGRRDLRECRYNQNEGYVIFSAMGSFFIPMAVMIYVYARISCVIASRHDNMTDISVHNKAGVTTTSTSGNTGANTNSKSLSNRITSLKKENKTTQTLSIVVGGFIACWLPFFINYLITPFLAEHQASQMLAKALTWLGWFNSAINPFIYAFYSVDFRAAFWRLTCKRFFSAGQKPQFPTNTMSIRR